MFLFFLPLLPLFLFLSTIFVPLPAEDVSSPNPPPSSSAPPATDDEVDECLNKLVLKFRNLNGAFFTQKQGMIIMIKCYEMYLVRKMSPMQIASYFYYTLPNLGLTPAQYQTMADIYAALVQLMGKSTSSVDTMYAKGVDAAVEVIDSDKREADRMIARMEAEGKPLNDIKLAVCLFTLPLVNPQKKVEVIIAVGKMLPADKREFIREQMEKMIKMDEIPRMANRKG